MYDCTSRYLRRWRREPTGPSCWAWSRSLRLRRVPATVYYAESSRETVGKNPISARYCTRAYFFFFFCNLFMHNFLTRRFYGCTNSWSHLKASDPIFHVRRSGNTRDNVLSQVHRVFVVVIISRVSAHRTYDNSNNNKRLAVCRCSVRATRSDRRRIRRDASP